MKLARTLQHQTYIVNITSFMRYIMSSRYIPSVLFENFQ